jgi:2-polyprenyl-3-methyl-5-hydroxy-6-metoxy-1,4-benzoquinol methylase
MREFLLQLLRSPKSMRPLKLYPFIDKTSAFGEIEIIEGILLSDDGTSAYPILNGVPVMLDSSFTREFLQKHAAKMANDKVLSQIILPEQRKALWSFSDEWNIHFNSNLVKTWGFTVDERVQQFFLETGVDPEWCTGRLILDAGCGNGQLSEGLSRIGANIIGLDYSESVFHAECRRQSPTVHFVQGDLQNPPFEPGTFDLIISNGVLHHTPNTNRTFVEVARLVKQEGRLYLWLYRRSEIFKMRFLVLPLIELMRAIASRASPSAQKLIVKSYASVLVAMHKVSRRRGDCSWQEYLVGAYDAVTPKWRHYHTPLEVAYWFFLNGYSAPVVTHWDNPYGFGMVAEKKPQGATPGRNFGKTNTQRYWK